MEFRKLWQRKTTILFKEFASSFTFFFYLDVVLAMLSELFSVQCDALIVRNLPVQPIRYLTFSKLRLKNLNSSETQLSTFQKQEIGA